MAKKERGFFGKAIVILLAIFAVIGLVAMALSIACPYVDPSRFVWLAFFGLAFWEIFAFNVLIFILLLLMWSRKVWIAVLALAISIPGVSKSFAFGSKVESTEGIKVMSYNVHMFLPLNGETEKEDVANQVINMLREQSPDLFCCQEFESYKRRVSRQQCIEEFAEMIGLPYFYYNRNHNYGGNVIFSKWPVEKVSEESGFGQENTYGVMVSVDAGERGVFYLANMHLVSFMISKDEINVLTGSPEGYKSLDTMGMDIARKLKYAYERRSEEITGVLETMPAVEGPIIMCGDFNDTPLSYVYRQMQKAGFTDTFTKVGRGIKPTYAGRLPLLRIDYMWANDQVKPLHYKRCRIKTSDHYPILLEFTLNNSKLQTANSQLQTPNSKLQTNN